jgi:hypothetical protein
MSLRFLEDEGDDPATTCVNNRNDNGCPEDPATWECVQPDGVLVSNDAGAGYCYNKSTLARVDTDPMRIMNGRPFTEAERERLGYTSGLDPELVALAQTDEPFAYQVQIGRTGVDISESNLDFMVYNRHTGEIRVADYGFHAYFENAWVRLDVLYVNGEVTVNAFICVDLQGDNGGLVYRLPFEVDDVSWELTTELENACARWACKLLDEPHVQAAARHAPLEEVVEGLQRDRRFSAVIPPTDL